MYTDFESQSKGRQYSDAVDYVDGLSGAADGLATLDSNGKLDANQVPSLSLSQTFTASSEATQLSLPIAPDTRDVNIGDICVRSDENKTYICIKDYDGSESSANFSTYWQELLTPTDVVLSVAGKIGNVTLVAADLTDITATAAELNYCDGVSENIQTQLNEKLGFVTDDSYPKLGGNLDLNGFNIITTANGNIILYPNGTGQTVVKSNTSKFGDGNNVSDIYLTADTGEANLPRLRYNVSLNTWQFSNDGSLFVDFASSTSGMTAVENDATPTLGGNLDMGGFTVGYLTENDTQYLHSMASTNLIIGIKIDHSSSNPALTYVDINKNTLNLDASFFDNHPVWGRIRRCVIDSDNAITYGSNARGDGLTLDGTAGDVMVEFPHFYWTAERIGDAEYHWISPYAFSGLPIHPWFVQRGQYESNMYLGAYGASFALDGATPKLYSKTGVNPVTGSVGYTDLPGDSFTIANSETYANNKGTGWGSACWWSWHARMLLMYFDFGTRNIQIALGRGVVDLASGVGYAGLANGADSSDSNVGTNGTGTGTGIDGQTPVVWRGLADPHGGWYEFVTGILAVDAGYQIVNRLGLESAIMPAGSFASADDYEMSATAPILTNGYISDYVSPDALLDGLFFPSDTGGSSSTYACDEWFAHDSGEQNICACGGQWYRGSGAGPGLQAFDTTNTGGTDRIYSARLEFKPQEA